MKAAISTEIQQVINSVHYHPAISIIIPFEPKMSVKAELTHYLKRVVDKVEKLIRNDYSDDLSDLVIEKLRTIISSINFNTFKKSLAIYVSPVFEKVFYIDIEVEEKIIIDESFEIRDLIYARKEIRKYLVLALSGEQTKVFYFDGDTFNRIKSNVPQNVAVVEYDLPGRVANFSDPRNYKETLLKKFLHETDQGLTLLLKSYPFPVFVTGTKKVLGHFRAITKNEKNILQYVDGNHEDITAYELRKLMEPLVNDWKKINMEKLRLQIDSAASADKLAVGIDKVCGEVNRHKGRLLMVEKNFMVQSERTGNVERICKPVVPYNKFSCVKDVVDDLIEKVLQDGGDVEFVDDGMLKDYDHIVLIQYY